MNIAMKWLQWMNVITCNDTDSSENGLSGYLAKQLEMHLKNELKESSNLVFYTQSTIAVTSGWVKESKLARKRSQLKDLLMWGPPHWPQWHHQLQIHSCLPLPLSFCAHCCLHGTFQYNLIQKAEYEYSHEVTTVNERYHLQWHRQFWKWTFRLPS